MDAANSRQRLTAMFAPLIASVRGSTSSRLILPIAPVVAAIVATSVALVFLLMPIETLETLAEESGLASMVTAAEPPLGITARFAFAFIAALVVGGVTWIGMFLLLGARTVIVNRGKRADGVPKLRRADAHPDAPARRPVFATSDLGTPFLDVKAEPVVEATTFAPPAVATDIPKDLDTPLAAYLTPSDEPLPEPEPLPIMAEPPVPEPIPEPAAFAPAPIAAPRFAPHERIETFELTPMVRATDREPEPETSAPLAPATIHDLLARLERGVQRRAEAAPPEPVAEESAEPSLDDTLCVLRQLASRVG